MSIDDIVTELLLRWEDDPALSPEELCRPYQGHPEYAALLEALRRELGALRAADAFLDTSKGVGSEPGLGVRQPSPEVHAAGGAPRPRYRPVAFHAKGGLGEVYRAEDEELHREVALKRIKEDHRGDAEQRRAFLREAEITARLEHPGVVPVHGLQVDADGEPYYAMRFIRGESLDAAIKQFHEADRQPRRDPGERSLALRQLLSRFVAVCNTVAYAHSRGILHRDLKPANVMLGAYGETLVVDWGLAKPFARTEAERATGEQTLQPTAADAVAASTLPGVAKGTPAYMSPEQAAGRWDELGPASDLFGLGATLYALLTGQPPFTGRTVPEVLQRARRCEFPPPRRVKPDVPLALEAICLKAMSVKPEERYGTALELAADVERFLADEPVRAYREPWRARLGRWARRHRPVVSGAVTLLLTAVVALAVGLVAVKREQLRTEQQRVAAVTAQRQADEQSRLALKTLKSVVFDIQRGLEDVPAGHRVRRRLLQTALDGLQEVARTTETASQKDRSLAAAHFHIGDIFLEAGGAGRGDWTREAQRHYQAGHEIAQALVAADPSSAITQRDLSASYEKLGDVSLKLGDAQAARGAYQKGLEVRQQLAAADPGSAAAQRDLFISYTNLGDVSRQLGDTKAARDYYQKGLDISQRLAAADPGSATAQRDLFVSYKRLGEVSLQLGDTRAARGAYLKGLEIAQRLAAADPGSVAAQRDLAISHDGLGDLSLRLEDFRAARDYYQKELDIAQRLAAADPGSAGAERDLSVSYEKLGDVNLELGETEAAGGAYQKGLDIRQKLAAADPANSQAQVDLFVSYYKLGVYHQEAFDFAHAADSHGRCLAILRRLVEQGKLKDQPQLAQWLKLAYHKHTLCQAVPQAVADLDFALKQPADLVPGLLYWRVRVLASHGQCTAAGVTADKFHDLAAADTGKLYDAACAYALCVPAVAPGKQPDQLTPEEKATRERYGARAVEVLREATRKGYKDVGHIKADKDLDPLRSRDDFRKLVAELEKAEAGGK